MLDASFTSNGREKMLFILILTQLCKTELWPNPLILSTQICSDDQTNRVHRRLVKSLPLF